MPRTLRILAHWLPLAAVATGICLLVYIALQQNYRMNANDPQIQLAEDTASSLESGASLQAVLSQASVNINASLAPFITVYDKSGKPVASSGSLDGGLPAFPSGALTASETKGENRVTWQPQTGLRFAAVVVPYSGGYVVAARSLREAESRVEQTGVFAGLTWIAAIFISLGLAIAGDFLMHPRSQPNDHW